MYFNFKNSVKYLKKLQPFQVWRKFISFQSVMELWKYQPTYLIVQTLFILGGLLTLFHGE